MLYISGTKESGLLTRKSLENFDCEALRRIDKLWLDYPVPKLGYFGFSVQKEIWQANGSPIIENESPIPSNFQNENLKELRQFYVDVGWKESIGRENPAETSTGYVQYNSLWRNFQTSSKGNLPLAFTEEWKKTNGKFTEKLGEKYPFLMQRTVTCNI